MSSKDYESEYELLQPWSAFILKTKLPKRVLGRMLKLTDEIVNNPKSKNHGPGLAGQIKWEPTIDMDLLKKIDVEDYFYEIIHQYCMRAHLQTNPFDYDEVPPLIEYIINEIWIISQKDNEYNPLHRHLGCNLSSVMYLKVPEFLPARKQREDEDGNICFHSSPMHPDGVFGHIGRISMKPKVGDFYLFPAEQMHEVYPFRTADGKGERRSVSFNVICSRNQEEFDKWEKDNRGDNFIKKTKKY